MKKAFPGCVYVVLVVLAGGAGSTLGQDGSIVAWGDNSAGQCNVPLSNSGFIAVAGGGMHSLGLKQDGSVVAWGDNSFNQCNVPLPNSNFLAIAAGDIHSLGLKQDGSIVAWGANLFGECSVPPPNSGFVAIAAGGFHSMGLMQGGSIVAWGDNSYGQCFTPEPNWGFVAIVGGGLYSVGLRQDGSMEAWGDNSYGQCVFLPPMGFEDIAAGYDHGLSLLFGSIFCWGSNSAGQCIVPEPNTGFTAVAGGGIHSLGLKEDGSIVAWGDNSFGQCSVPAPNTGFTAIAAGGVHSLGLAESVGDRVATPVFSPGGGSYDDEQQVTITCSTPGATIHYTTDGSEPTESDPVIASGNSVSITASLTLKARAWKDGLDPSNIQSAFYQFIVSSPSFSPGGGTYSTEQDVTIACSTSGATIHYTTDGSDPTQSDPVIVSGDSVSITTSLTLKARAWKDGLDPSNIKSASYQLVVSRPYFSPTGGTYNSEQEVAIFCTTPGATIHYTTDGSDPDESDPAVASGDTILIPTSLTLKAKAWKDDMTPSSIRSATYQLVVAQPQFSPPGGGYNTPQEVTITCMTPGATIHYTTDGSEPTESASSMLSGGTVLVSVDPPTTLKARGFKAGMNPSSIKEAIYLIPSVIFVSPTGDNSNDGLSWTTAKRTVQAGLNAALAGDHVWVAAGTYLEWIQLKAGVALYGGFAGTEDPETFDLDTRDLATNVTCLDGNQAGTVVTVDVSATETTRIDGFTIRNGFGSYGGGIELGTSSPTIANNTITGNRSDGLFLHEAWDPHRGCGGGINSSGGNPVITGNVIADNRARGYVVEEFMEECMEWDPVTGECLSWEWVPISREELGEGGGIYCYGGSPTITHNTITGNNAESPWGGGGVGGGVYRYSSAGGSTLIANNTITGNGGSPGGGIYSSGSSVIANNTIAGNRDGDGVYSSGSSVVANNVIAGNTGRGVHFATWSDLPTIVNNIVAFNSSGISGDTTFRHNCVFGNFSYDYSGTDPTGTDGNISVDPLLLRLPDAGPDGQWGTADDDYGDLRLQTGSPCIDAGENDGVPAGIATDLAGRPRFMDDPDTPDTGNGTPPIVDIGAYEFVPTVAADFDGDGDVDADDFEIFRACASGPGIPYDPESLPPGCSLEPDDDDFIAADLVRDGNIDQIDFAVFQRCWSGEDVPVDLECARLAE